MKEIIEHEAMDTILKYLIDNKTDKPIYSFTIWKELFPDVDKEIIYFLLNKIIDTVDEIVITHIRSNVIRNYEVFFEANGLTKIFLYNQGGFTALYEKKEKEQKEILRLETVKNRKLESDAKLSEWQVKTFWWIFIFGLFGLIFGVYNFIDNLKTAKEKELQEQTNQRMESELSKLHTLVLDHETVDSLHNSKTHNNGLRQR